MNLVEHQLDRKAKIIQIIFGLLVCVIPFVRIKQWGLLSVRVPQCWLWVFGAIVLYALSQKNIWLGLYLIYCSGLLIVSRINSEYYFNFKSIGATRVTHLHPDFAKKFLGLILPNKISIFFIDAYFYNFVFGLICLCLIIFLINLVQKMNTKWLSCCILITSCTLFVIWLGNDVLILLKNIPYIDKHIYTFPWMSFDNQWVAGAFLAFSIPYVFTLTDKRWLSIPMAGILLGGCCLTKSTMAILAAYIGILTIFVFKKWFKILTVFLLLTILSTFFLSKDLKNRIITDSFRWQTWKQSINHVGFNWWGTGLRSYRAYGFMEGVGTLKSHAHNEFLEVYCETGVIGLLLLLFFIIDLLSVKCPVEYKAALIAILLHCAGYYTTRLAATGMLIIITTGIIESYRLRRIKNEKNNDNIVSAHPGPYGLLQCTNI